MAFEVKVPGVGESVQEGMISSWSVQTGDFVEQDDVLCELETDKASVELTAEVDGVVELIAEEGSVVKVGEVIAKIDESKSAGSSPKKASESSSDAKAEAAAPQATSSSNEKENGPAVRRMAEETGVDPSSIAGTGRGGRVTKEDMVKASGSGAPSKAPEKKAAPAKSAPDLPAFQATGERTETRKPMSMLRRRIAERLIESQKTAAILTTFNEVDMTAVLETRKKYKDAFEKRHGIKLGFMGFFLKASVEALQDFPLVNASIDGNDIIYRNFCDIGVAVSTPKGLMVPVIRNVHQMTLADVEQEIMRFANKARDNKISVDDLSGGTFTVSNGGVFGSLMSTPIINPPQTGILGMHKTQMRPMVMEDGSIQARPMMYLALSYDHRIIDGKEAVQFLVRIKDCIEDPQRLLLGV